MSMGAQASLGWTAPLVLLVIGALLTLLTNFGLRRWQYGVERWNTRVDWFCETLTETADIGIKYWIELPSKVQTLKTKKPEILNKEIQILGLQVRLDGILATIEDRFNLKDKRKIRNALADFRDTLTGGNFQTSASKSDHIRARELQMKASELFILVREASDRSSKLLWK